jgi:nucleoside-diphosphate-sugar epimerase
LRLAEERVGDQRWYVSDTASLRAATGWQPDVGVTEGVTDLYRWLGGTRASFAEVATA